LPILSALYTAPLLFLFQLVIRCAIYIYIDDREIIIIRGMHHYAA
jgi:hypothetical protein